MTKDGKFGTECEIQSFCELYPDVSVIILDIHSQVRYQFFANSTNELILRFSGFNDGGHYDVIHSVNTNINNNVEGNNYSSQYKLNQIFNFGNDFKNKFDLNNYIQHFLKDDFSIVKIFSDNNSLYRCFSYFIYQNDRFFSKIKAYIIDHIQQNWRIYKQKKINEKKISKYPES